MKVIGVDPGLAETGWVLLERPAPGTGASLLGSGVLRTPPSLPLPERLRRLHAGLEPILHSMKPDVLAIEEMFFLKAAHTVRASLQARGVILLAASQARLPVVEYNPRQVKSCLTGSGTAPKAQMLKMVQRTLSLPAPLRPDDVSDAAAIALCHLRVSRQGRLRVLERVGGKGPP